MKTLCILLALVCTSAFAGALPIAHTKAYLFDGLDPLEEQSMQFYDEFRDDNLAEIKYSELENATLEAAARAAPVNTDMTFGNVRVRFFSTKVAVMVDGNCETNFLTSHTLHFSDLRVSVDGVDLPLNTQDPPADDTYTFAGGTLILNEAVRDEHTNSIIAIDLRLDGGERHTWGYAYAALECPVPVELQSFEVE